MLPGRLPLLAALVALACVTPGEAVPPRILILSGENNHDWRSTTPVLKAILEEGQTFEITVNERVAELQPNDLEGVAAVLSNFNTFGKGDPVPVWGTPMRNFFIEWIRRGHGLVVVHAGSSEFYDWPEFQALACTSWGKASRHGRIHSSTVVIAPTSHPITASMADFETRDEFWESSLLSARALVLATVTPKVEFGGSGRPEPIAMATTLGEGRGFTLLLGHDAAAMRNVGFKVFLRRGTEWAATGGASIAEGIPTKQ